ncbi:MAG: flagellar hook capping FlgD N-terminal domain-containing protein [bacterium]
MAAVTPLATPVDFLKLLVTQLEYQNPLDPLDNAEFLGQMAEFSNLQQLISLNENFSELTTNFAALNSSVLKTQALSLLNTVVNFTDPVNGEIFTGMVYQVKFIDGIPKLTVIHDQGTSEIGLDNIISVMVQ